LAIR